MLSASLHQSPEPKSLGVGKVQKHVGNLMEGCSQGLENSYFGPIVAMGSSRQKVTDNGLIWGFLDHIASRCCQHQQYVLWFDVSRVAVACYILERRSRLCYELVILSFEIERV